MRALHQVRPHEKFFASGVYHYLVDEQPTGVVEHWSIYQLPDQSQLIRVDRDGRDSAAKTSLLIEVLRSEEGQIERCDMRLYYPHEKATREARATYNFTATQMEIGRIVDGNRIDEVVTLPPQTIIYLPARIFVGNVIAQLGEGKANLFVPLSEDATSPQLLSGRVLEGAAQLQGEEAVAIKQKSYATRRYQFNIPTEDTLCWLDEYNVLIRSRRNLNNRVETTILTQYARKP